MPSFHGSFLRTSVPSFSPPNIPLKHFPCRAGFLALRGRLLSQTLDGGMRFASSSLALRGVAEDLNRDLPPWRPTAQVHTVTRVATNWGLARGPGRLVAPAEPHFCRANRPTNDAPLGGPAHDLRILASLARPVLFTIFARPTI